MAGELEKGLTIHCQLLRGGVEVGVLNGKARVECGVDELGRRLTRSVHRRPAIDLAAAALFRGGQQHASPMHRTRAFERRCAHIVRVVTQR